MATITARPSRVLHRRNAGGTCMSARTFGTVCRHYGSRAAGQLLSCVTPDPVCGGITAAYVYADAHMMGIRSLVLSALVAVLGACGDDPSTEIVCSGGTTGGLSAGGTVEVTGGSDLKGAAITAQARTTVPAGDVSIECAEDIVPDG